MKRVDDAAANAVKGVRQIVRLNDAVKRTICARVTLQLRRDQFLKFFKCRGAFQPGAIDEESRGRFHPELCDRIFSCLLDCL